jgi:hypothetical protein
MAVDGALGWSFHRETDVHIHSDVLWHRFDVFDVPEGQLPLYFGVGGRVKFRDCGPATSALTHHPTDRSVSAGPRWVSCRSRMPCAERRGE